MFLFVIGGVGVGVKGEEHNGQVNSPRDNIEGVANHCNYLVTGKFNYIIWKSFEDSSATQR